MNAPLAPLRKRARNYVAQSLHLSSETKGLGRPLHPQAQAVTLLSEIIARLHGVPMPVVQFIRISQDPGASDIAGHFAHASAACLGRTLLIRAGAPEAPRRSSVAKDVATTTVSRRRVRKTAPDWMDIVPDSAVAGLCHARLGLAFGDALLAPASPVTWLDGVALDFRLIAIESDAPDRCPANLDLATRCHGSVLVVTAGATDLLRTRSVMRQVQLAGGTLLGSVLHDAPPTPRVRLPAWLSRATGKSAT